MLLEVKNLNVSFSTPVVKDVNFCVKEGSWTTIVGESGSGKTISALSICRLLKPRHIQGEIIFYSKKNEATDLLRLPETELVKIRGKEIATIFQDPASSLNPLMRIGRQIQEAYQAHVEVEERSAVQKTKEALASLRIRDVQRVFASYPHELSGGMKQRVMIAMALISNPKLLIADEPTTALDASTEKEIVELLLQIKQERALSILFITHNLTLALAHSENIYVMREGRIVEALDKENGFRPQEAYTKRLFSAQLTHAKPKSIIEV